MFSSKTLVFLQLPWIPAVTRGLTLAYPTALFAVSHPSVLLPQYIPRSAVKG